MGCTETGQFQVDCETYHSSPNLVIPGQGSGQIQRTLHVLHNSEYPATVFSVLEPQAASQLTAKSQPQQNQANNRITFTTDYLFDLLLLKLSSVYQKNKQNQKIESKGNRYEIGDFVVKVGQCFSSLSIIIHYNGKKPSSVALLMLTFYFYSLALCL